MADIEKCPTCGNECSENATSCPKCGEPLLEGWAKDALSDRIKAEETEAAAQEKESNNHFMIIGIVVVVILGLIGQGWYRERFEANLTAVDREQEAKKKQDLAQSVDRTPVDPEQIKKLENLVRKVPVHDFDENIRLYRQLLSLHPGNKRYINKINHYEGKKRAAKNEFIKKKRAAKNEVVNKEKAAKRRRGFHCLSSWDGAHTGVKRYIEKHMRNPDSFEHIETRITPVNSEGSHELIMKYRAQNGFGGMTVGITTASVRNSDCHASILTSE